jgi:hypothetical protein
MFWYSRRALGALVLLGSLTACLRVGRDGASFSFPIPAAMVGASKIEYTPPAPRANALTNEEYKAIGPRIRSLRSDPTEFRLSVGDTIRASEVLRIMAFDSAGTVLGEIPFYDYSISGRGVRMTSDARIVLVRAGTFDFIASLPEDMWRGRKASRPKVRVEFIASH